MPNPDSIALDEPDDLPETWPDAIEFPEFWSVTEAADDMRVLHELRSRMRHGHDDPDGRYPDSIK